MLSSLPTKHLRTRYVVELIRQSFRLLPPITSFWVLVSKIWFSSRILFIAYLNQAWINLTILFAFISVNIQKKKLVVSIDKLKRDSSSVDFVKIFVRTSILIVVLGTSQLLTNISTILYIVMTKTYVDS